jgi:hypothetical protein
LSESQASLQLLQDRYDALLTEHDTALLGHNNKKQKIHYMTVLKQQINELIQENRKLRLAAAAASPSSGSRRESILSTCSGERL